MDFEIEDVVFIYLAFIVFALYLGFLLKYDSAFPSLLILWIGIPLLLIVYSYIYKRKNRDMKILKIRMLFSIPMYPVALYYSYLVGIGHDLSRNEMLLPYGFVLTLLILGVIAEFVYRKRKK